MKDEELNAEHSGKAVNRCIVGLSVGKNDVNDVVGRWGDVRVRLFSHWSVGLWDISQSRTIPRPSLHGIGHPSYHHHHHAPIYI